MAKVVSLDDFFDPAIEKEEEKSLVANVKADTLKALKDFFQKNNLSIVEGYEETEEKGKG